MHRHSSRRGFLKLSSSQVRFWKPALAISNIQIFFFHIGGACIVYLVYLFRLLFKIIFFHISFHVTFWHSWLLKRRKNVCRQTFWIMGEAKIKLSKSRCIAPLMYCLKQFFFWSNRYPTSSNYFNKIFSFCSVTNHYVSYFETSIKWQYGVNQRNLFRESPIDSLMSK